MKRNEYCPSKTFYLTNLDSILFYSGVVDKVDYSVRHKRASSTLTKTVPRCYPKVVITPVSQVEMSPFVVLILERQHVRQLSCLNASDGFAIGARIIDQP